jgi:hypothetical protein
MAVRIILRKRNLWAVVGVKMTEEPELLHALHSSFVRCA